MNDTPAPERPQTPAPAGLPPAARLQEGPEGGWLEVSMGPQHPSTHGVFRMDVVLEGETVVKLKPVFGYLHRNHEKIAETLSYLGVIDPRFASRGLLLDGADGVEGVLSIRLVIVRAFHCANGAPLKLAAGEIAHRASAAGGRGLKRLRLVPRLAPPNQRLAPAFLRLGTAGPGASPSLSARPAPQSGLTFPAFHASHLD